MRTKLSFKRVLALVMAVAVICANLSVFTATTVFAGGGDMQPVIGESISTENDLEEIVCICEKTCTEKMICKECEVCSEDYTKCEYITPNIKITISTEAGWYNDRANVNVDVMDIAESGNFIIQSVMAKISHNGSWVDITEDMMLEISENCSIYVLVTDQKGNTYEKNRAMMCFDKEKPTLNAAVSDGLLSIKAHDTASGVKAVYVNGYEFTNLTNGTLNIRLQQFDTGYQYFTIQAMDFAGNMSGVYKTANPYYTDPKDKDDNSKENPAEQLPVDANPTKPTNATANVTNHTKVDSSGNEVKTNTSNSEKGKEFYTIQTKTDKVFYLIIDRDGDEEVVYFLTEITENDLLNVTTDNSEILPKNSVALESAIPITDDKEEVDVDKSKEDLQGDVESSEPEQSTTDDSSNEPATNPGATYIVIGVLAVASVGVGYYFKVVKGKKEQFIDEDEEEEFYEDDSEEKADDFFDNSGEEE